VRSEAAVYPCGCKYRGVGIIGTEAAVALTGSATGERHDEPPLDPSGFYCRRNDRRTGLRGNAVRAATPGRTLCVRNGAVAAIDDPAGICLPSILGRVLWRLLPVWELSVPLRLLTPTDGRRIAVAAAVAPTVGRLTTKKSDRKENWPKHKASAKFEQGGFTSRRRKGPQTLFPGASPGNCFGAPQPRKSVAM